MKLLLLAVTCSFFSIYFVQAQETHGAIIINATDNGTIVPLSINDNLSSPYGRYLHLSRGNDTHFFDIGLDPQYNYFCISKKNNSDLTVPAFSISENGVGIGNQAITASFPLDIEDGSDLCPDGVYTHAKIGTRRPLYFVQNMIEDTWSSGIAFSAYIDNKNSKWIYSGDPGASTSPGKSGYLSFDENGTFSFNITSGSNGTPITSWAKPFIINNLGQVGIGTGDNALTQQLEVAGTIKATKFMLSDGTILTGGSGGSGGSSPWTTSGANIYYKAGNLLIGKTTQTNAAYKLDVAGSVRANEVVVNTTGADFVFEPTYKLCPLADVETFIKQNKHLPEMASATEMQTNGISMGDMQAKLLQKLEELTLYSIEQNKAKDELKLKVEEQSNQIQEQRKENEELKLEMKELKELIMKKLK